MSKTTTQERKMTTATTRSHRTYTIGQSADLPDGPTVIITAIEHGTEYGEPVFYITGRNSLGDIVTRWVSA